jgi:hypothetical protein
LRRKGFSLRRFAACCASCSAKWAGGFEVLQANTDLHLVTDGKSIFLEDHQERIIDILKNARQPMFLVCVSDQARRLGESDRKPVRMESGLAARRARMG